MKLFTKKQKPTVRKYAVIRTAGKGYQVEYKTPRKIVHGGEF